jgi:hypothetical protein
MVWSIESTMNDDGLGYFFLFSYFNKEEFIHWVFSWLNLFLSSVSMPPDFNRGKDN